MSEDHELQKKDMTEETLEVEELNVEAEGTDAEGNIPDEAKLVQNDEAQTAEVQNGGEVPPAKKRRRMIKIRFCHVATVLSFFVPFTLMIALFVGNSIYPFGNRSFLFSDMYHQYMPFFEEFVRLIRSGKGLDYTWNIGIGSNFLALYVYYLASPFNWLGLLFPTGHIMEFMSYMVVIKIGLSGLTAFLYLKSRHKDLKDSILFGALIASLFYAMSGFVAAYNWNVMWMDCIVLFPLIMMGIERLVKQGKMGLYVITLGLCIYTNFYISIMVCLFLVIYFIYLFLAEKRSFSMIWKFALGSLMAGGLAAVLLIPVVKALMATDFGAMDIPKEWKVYFDVIDMLARHGAAVTTERALEHWPNIYCGAMVFFMIPLYVVNEKIPARRRLGFMAMAGLFLMSFSVNVLDFFWHGLNYPDSLPARQSFIYVLIILVACHDCFSNLDGLKKGMVVRAYLGAAVFLVMVQKFVDVSDFKPWTWILNLGFVTIYAACLYVFLTKGRTAGFVVACIAAVAVMGEATVNMAYTSVGTTDRVAYLKQLKDYDALYQRSVPEKEGVADAGFSRIEKFTRKTKNDSVLVGYPSASIFSSTMNSKVMDLYTKLGMQHSKVFYGYDGATPLNAALLNVGYMFGETDEWENELFTIIDEENGLYLYQANYSVPFGYVAPKDFDLPTGINDKGITLQNKLARELGAYSSLLSKQDSKEEGDDVSFTADVDGIYYGYVTKSGTSKLKISGLAEKDRNYKDLKSGVLFYVGSMEEGQDILITNGDDKDTTKKISVAIYKLDLDAVEQVIRTLSKTHMTDVTVDNRTVTGKVELTEAGRLILSIPVDDGWKIYVNGEETEGAEFGKALIALDLEPGSYDVRLEYQAAGKNLGLYVTLVTLAFTLLVLGLPWGVKSIKKRI